MSPKRVDEIVSILLICLFLALASFVWAAIYWMAG